MKLKPWRGELISLIERGSPGMPARSGLLELKSFILLCFFNQKLRNSSGPCSQEVTPDEIRECGDLGGPFVASAVLLVAERYWISMSAHSRGRSRRNA